MNSVSVEWFEGKLNELYRKHYGPEELGVGGGWYRIILDIGTLKELYVTNLIEHPNFPRGVVISLKGFTSESVFKKGLELVEEKFVNGNILQSQRSLAYDEEQHW